MVGLCVFFVAWLVGLRFGFFCRFCTCLVGSAVCFPEELQTQYKSKADDQYKECKGASQVPPRVPASLCPPAVTFKGLFR